jgi:aspartyl protease family protein
MLLPIVLAVVVATMIALMLFGDGEQIAGLPPYMLASLVSGVAMALMVLSWSASEYRGRWKDALQAALAWVLIFGAFMTGYAYRFELQDGVNRVLGELAPGYTVAARGGEVTITRSRSGSFIVAGRINGRDSRFLFDTGASTVVLTDATARAIGIDTSTLNYDVPVSTANGRTTAARTRIDRIDIGSITQERITAMVARPGALSENLLGMSFLERLQSYEVRDERLILRGGR